MWIMIAGPYRAGGGAADPTVRAANLRMLNEAAVSLQRAGHVPIIGVNMALPMIEAAGGMVVNKADKPGTPGLAIHEMGTATMGKDPKNSVLGKFSQAHDVPNLFVTDGAAMASSGCQNPSLTYMALSARAAHHAAEFLKDGTL